MDYDMGRLLTDALGYVLLGLVLAVTAAPLDIPVDCSAQLHMPCNVTLEYGSFSVFGQQWDGSGGVSAPINFTPSYKCGSSDEYVLHLEWKPSDDVSFDILTGYAVDIRQAYDEFGEDGFEKFHLMFTVNNSEYVRRADKVLKLDFSYDLPGMLISGWVYTIILYSLPIGTGSTNQVKREDLDLIQARGCSASTTEISTTTELPYTESSSPSTREVSTPDDDKTHSSTTYNRISQSAPPKLPYTESSSPSTREVSTPDDDKTHSSTTYIRISQSAPPIDVGLSVGFGVLACVVVIAVVAFVAVVYRLRVWRRPPCSPKGEGCLAEVYPREPSSAITHSTQFPTETSTDSGIGDDPIGKANEEYDLDSLSISSRCSSFVPVTNC